MARWRWPDLKSDKFSQVAQKLNYVSSSQWSGPVFFFASKGAAIQYKYIWKQGATTTYEGGANRNYTVPTSGSGSRNDT